MPLTTSNRVRIYVQMGDLAAGSAREQAVSVAAHPHVVPDETMAHAVIFGRGSLADFSVRKYVDTSPSETVVIFTA